jgi:hypothetical protein
VTNGSASRRIVSNIITNKAKPQRSFRRTGADPFANGNPDTALLGGPRPGFDSQTSPVQHASYPALSPIEHDVSCVVYDALAAAASAAETPRRHLRP